VSCCVAGSVAEIVGKSGAKKTFVALDLSFSIATGRPWHGRIVREGTVLYVAGEGKSGMGGRISAWETARYATLPADRFRLITDAPQLLDDTHVDALIATVQRWNAGMVVLDTLARTMGGGGENRARDMGDYVAACNRIQRETGATVVVVHHMGWAGEHGRGSSALFAAVDAEITVTKDGNTVNVRVSKAKDFPDGEETTFASRVVELANGGTSLVLDECAAAPASITGIAKRVGKMLWETFGTEGATLSKWERVCLDAKIAAQSVYDGRKNLARGGFITVPNGYQRGFRYTVTDAFLALLNLNAPQGTEGTTKFSEGTVVPSEVPVRRYSRTF